MEFDISLFFRNAAPMDYSASRAEIGESAGEDTWRAACNDSDDYPILTNADHREAFAAFVQSSGGWTAEEIAEWTDTELNALCIQWIARDMREAGLSASATDAKWTDYQSRAEQGQCNSNLYQADDGRVYWSCES